MKFNSLYYLLIFTLFSTYLNAQDYIVIDKKEKINCKILEKNDSYIKFSVVKDGKIKIRKVPTSVVTSYYYSKEEKKQSNTNIKTNYTRNRLSKSNSMWRLEAELFIPFVKNLTPGLAIGGNYYFDKNFGIGFDYSLVGFFQESNFNGIVLKESFALHTFHPSFCSKGFLDKNNKVIFFSSCGLGLGLVNGSIVELLGSKTIGEVTYSGATLSLRLRTGIDYMVSKNLALGASLCYHGGKINDMNKNVKYYDNNFPIIFNDKSFSISYIYFGMGIKYYFN